MEEIIFRISDRYNLYKGDFKGHRFFLFNVEDGSIFRLNETSYDMLSFFDGEKTVGQILRELKKIYEVNEDNLRQDLFRLIDKWKSKDILMEGGETS